LKLFSVAGIFVPETRRYFKSSHSGLWKTCRYSLTPHILPNSTAARNFTTLAYTNPNKIFNLKSELAKQPYIDEFLAEKIDLDDVDEVNEVDNNFLQHLFGYWVREQTTQFTKFKNVYKKLTPQIKTPARKKLVMINPTNITAVNETIGGALSTVVINNTNIHVIVPYNLRQALFDDWEERDKVVYLLWQYSKDMDIVFSMENMDGHKYIIMPPKPPKKGKIGSGYEYLSTSKCFYYNS
jgi:hypothetical protein